VNPKRLWARIQQGNVHNIDFNDFRKLIEGFGFVYDHERGDHIYYRHPRVREILNIQERGGQAKHYQVRELRDRVQEYDLELGGSDE
jgi:hypothetical protein